MEKTENFYVSKVKDLLSVVSLVGNPYYTSKFKRKDGKERWSVISRSIMEILGNAAKSTKKARKEKTKWVVSAKSSSWDIFIIN